MEQNGTNTALTLNELRANSERTTSEQREINTVAYHDGSSEARESREKAERKFIFEAVVKRSNSRATVEVRRISRYTCEDYYIHIVSVFTLSGYNITACDTDTAKTTTETL